MVDNIQECYISQCFLFFKRYIIYNFGTYMPYIILILVAVDYLVWFSFGHHICVKTICENLFVKTTFVVKYNRSAKVDLNGEKSHFPAVVLIGVL